MALEQRSLSSVAFDRHLQTFALLDGAGIPQLRKRLDAANAEYLSLYRGNIDPQLLEASPFLVKLEESATLTKWILEGAWQQNWGIFALSSANMQSVLTHFRKFLTVQDPEGQKMYFRFYDPRVLRVFLPTCERGEMDSFFGPIERFVMKGDETNEGSVFTVHSGQHSFLVTGGV